MQKYLTAFSYFRKKLHHRCSTGFLMRHWKDWNFQDDTKVGQIIAIVTTSSVSCLVLKLFYPAFTFNITTNTACFAWNFFHMLATSAYFTDPNRIFKTVYCMFSLIYTECVYKKGVSSFKFLYNSSVFTEKSLSILQDENLQGRKKATFTWFPLMIMLKFFELSYI